MRTYEIPYDVTRITFLRRLFSFLLSIILLALCYSASLPKEISFISASFAFWFIC